MRMLKRFFLVIFFLAIFFSLTITGITLGAANNTLSPDGYWKTIDDETKEVESIVKVWNENGEVKGKIVKTFPKPGEDPDPKCDQCPGDLKDARIIGMNFMWGFKKDEDDEKWVNGRILDPDNGKTYRCQLEVVDNGGKMEVFGYIRIIIKIGRSQTWLRYEPQPGEKLEE